MSEHERLVMIDGRLVDEVVFAMSSAVVRMCARGEQLIIGGSEVRSLIPGDAQYADIERRAQRIVEVFRSQSDVGDMRKPV